MSYQKFYKMKCVSCGKYWQEEETTSVCLDCHEALDIEYDYKTMKGRLNFYALKNSPISSRKYLDFYPINDLNQLVTRNEGGTSLIVCKNLRNKFGLNKLFIKDEVTNPTGCYKDRGSLVEITKAKELGAKAVCCASTGNMAASVSAYSAIAKIPCYVLIPEGTPMGKMAQSLAYGARILQIRGTYNDCVRLCEEMSKKNGFYLAGDYVFRMEGQKSVAYEICEQLFWKAPDFCVVPMGCGTLISSIWKGFKEFYEFGFIDKLPRMIGVQPENVSTIVAAWKKGKKRAIVVEKPQTVASAVGIGKPQDDIKALRTLKESKGLGETATEEEILATQLIMANSESIFVEPSSAIPVAVLNKLIKQKIIKKNDIVVCVTTGIGLKDPKSATSILPDPPVLEPETKEVERYLKFKLYDIKASGTLNKEKELWKKVPNKTSLSKIIEKEFNIKLDKDYLDLLYQSVVIYHEKNDQMKKANLQYILESVLKQSSVKKEILKVVDYKLAVFKHKRPVAEVTVKYNSEEICVKTVGVGPVDAVINAVKEAIKSKDTLDIGLTDFNVEIDTKGTDATVEVKMELRDKFQNRITSIGVSPDIIVASIDAFEKGYNVLYAKNKIESSKRQDTRYKRQEKNSKSKRTRKYF